MKKIALVARREFVAAVLNRGFILGLLLMPALAALAAVAMPRLMSTTGPPVRGEVAVIDRTGQVAGALQRTLAPQAIADRRASRLRGAVGNAPEAIRAMSGGASRAVNRALGQVPQFLVSEHPVDAVQTQKQRLEAAPGTAPLALVVVHEDAVRPAVGVAQYGSYDLFVRPNLPDGVEAALFEGVREAIVDARVSARNLDRQEVEAVMQVARATPVEVSRAGEAPLNARLNRALPFVFTGLLLFAVLIGGQTLLTSMVEEKSSRVIEVLLSAVSPLELMAGKILGQLAVSLLALALYVGLGIVLLASFALLGLLDPWLVVYLLLFFLIAYLIFGSLFGAVGAAVNEMREAQSLMMPLMLVMMLPWFLAAPVARDPSSTLSVALSFTPMVNLFAMMVRLSSATPPPAWQVWLTLGIGLLTAAGTLWVASKVFTVGLLMHGKPPNLATLIRWVRTA